MSEKTIQEILQAINNDQELNELNIVEKIKDELQQHEIEMYNWWKDSEFDIDFNRFIWDRDNTLASRDNLLCTAARNGCEKVVRLLIERGAKVDLINGAEKAPLHEAAAHGHTELVDILLEKGANINMRGESRVTPLHEAVYHGHTEIVKMLLEKGAQTDLQNYMGSTPLHFAVCGGHKEIVKMLLEKGAQTDIKDFVGSTALDKAKISGDAEIVKMLLEKGAQTDLQDKDALDYVAFEEYMEVPEMPLESGTDMLI